MPRSIGRAGAGMNTRFPQAVVAGAGELRPDVADDLICRWNTLQLFRDTFAELTQMDMIEAEEIPFPMILVPGGRGLERIPPSR